MAPRATRASSKSSQDATSPATNGVKRKADSGASPQAKRGKTTNTANDKEQASLEQTMPGEGEDAAEKEVKDIDMEDAAEKVEANGTAPTKEGEADEAEQEMESAEKDTESKATTAEDKSNEQTEAKADKQAEQQQAATANDADKGDDGRADPSGGSKMDFTGDVHKTEDANAKNDSTEKTTNGDGAVESSQSRGDAMPSNILEKGIIYFFSRARVGLDHPGSIQDIARSYIVLRPLPQNAKLTDGPIDDLKNNRLLALPKKVLPRSHRDTFMTFVEKAGASIDELKEDILQGSTYSTATTGVRQSPSATPLGEGVYAITTTGRESHLAYMLTIPAELGPVQEEIGLAPKGSFVLSTKNPEQKGPANANLPEGPGYPKEMMEEFRGLRWLPTQPKHLDYVNGQLLLIGEGHGEIGKAVEAQNGDDNDEKKNVPEEEMEKLEDEDSMRVEGLSGDDSVFDDLNLSSKDYPKVQTTW